MTDETKYDAMKREALRDANHGQTAGGLFPNATSNANPCPPRKRRGAVVISVEKLARLLNLRDGIEIVGGRYDGYHECFELFVAGADGELPLKRPGGEICIVPLRALVDLD